jgi:hypothetical protein
MAMKSSPKYGWLAAALVATVLLAALLVLGCSDLSGSSTTGPEGTVTSAGEVTTVPPMETTTSEMAPGTTEAPMTTLAPSTTLPPAVTTTTDPYGSADDIVLPSGNIKAMGYITQVWEDASGRHLKIDYAVMLTGAAADAAAVAAGDIPPGEHVPNDYFITNVSTKIRTFKVSNAVVITTATRWAPHDGMTAPCTWADFLTFFNTPPASLPEGDQQLHDVPWWIERDGDTIVKIEEQYLP